MFGLCIATELLQRVSVATSLRLFLTKLFDFVCLNKMHSQSNI